MFGNEVESVVRFGITRILIEVIGFWTRKATAVIEQFDFFRFMIDVYIG